MSTRVSRKTTVQRPVILLYKPLNLVPFGSGTDNPLVIGSRPLFRIRQGVSPVPHRLPPGRGRAQADASPVRHWTRRGRTADDGAGDDPEVTAGPTLLPRHGERLAVVLGAE